MTPAAPAVALAALLTASCGASLMKLPPGPGAPAPDARDALAEATVACHNVTTLTAEIAVSGSVAGQRLRVRLLAGLAQPASVRLEAFAVGQPIFIFVARAHDATLLLQRDNRVLEHGPADAVLEAVTGVPLDPAALGTTLTGCPTVADWREAQQWDDDWRMVPDADGAVYLHRAARTAPWQLVAATHRDPSGTAWRVEYRNVVDGLPRDIRLTSGDRNRFNLRLVLSQVETNVALEAAELLRVRIPASADAITLEELKRAGPLGAASSGDPNGR